MQVQTHIPAEKEFLIKSVLLNESVELPPEVQKTLKLIRREKVKYPVVFIGTGTCGLISGAGLTLALRPESTWKTET
jgi:hypothetical protein